MPVAAPSTTSLRSLARRTLAAALAATLLVPATANAWDRVQFTEQPRTVGLATGTDKIAVWVCAVPGGTFSPDPTTAVSWLNAKVTPWFASMSNGRYTPEFSYLGSFSTTTEGTASEQLTACSKGAETRTPQPYTNSLALTTHDLYGGGGGIGGTGYATNLLKPPSETGRGAAVGGRVYSDDNAWLVGHEIGHTLGWPHYYTGPASEYDSPFDVMSGNKTTCRSCTFVHTTALNRWLAGWIDDTEVLEHLGAAASYAVQPHTVTGTKLVVVPTPTAGRYLTIEARVRALGDQNLTKAGLLVSVIDTVGASCWKSRCEMTSRRQAPAIGAPGSYDSLLAPGETLSSNGLTVTNTGTTGAGYTAAVSAITLAPSKPTALTVSEPQTGVARVTWQPPTSNGGQPVTSYRVTDTNTEKVLCTTSQTTCDVTVQSFRRYVFSVVALNATGASISTEIAYTAPAAPPATTSPSTPSPTPSTTPPSTTPNTTTNWPTDWDPDRALFDADSFSVYRKSRSLELRWPTLLSATAYVVTDEAGNEVCRTAVVWCSVSQLAPWKAHRFNVKAYAPSRETPYNIGTTGAVYPYLKIRASAKLSSIVPPSQRPSKWRAGSGCRIKKNLLTMTKSKCTVKLDVAGSPTRIELRR